MRARGVFFLFAAAGVILLGSWRVAHAGEADAEDAQPVYGAHYGYTSDVVAEKDKRDIEMVMLEEPKKKSKPLTEVIFNDKLSREFQQQYKYRFGQTQAEQVINSPGRSDEYTYYSSQNVTIQEYQKYQRQFAEYMGRRLVEFHFDNWAKNDPSFRPVYELKDRVSNLNVKVKKYKVKWKYNFAGPSMDVSVENPYHIEANLRAEMTGVISSPSEMIYSLGYPVSPRVKVAALYKQTDGLYQLVCTRVMTKHISTSLTGSIDARAEGPTVQQNLILVGFSWSE
jgi:hypothetical protein